MTELDDEAARSLARVYWDPTPSPKGKAGPRHRATDESKAVQPCYADGGCPYRQHCRNSGEACRPFVAWVRMMGSTNTPTTMSFAKQAQSLSDRRPGPQWADKLSKI